jgi:PAS domain S-box-containing protein
MSASPAAPVPPDELARLRRLIEESGDLLCRHAPDGTCLYASPACRELLGYEPDELLGRSGFLFVHPEDLEGVTENQTELLTGSGRRTVVCRVRHREGHAVWIESTVHALRDPGSGAVVEVLSSSRDVTARLHAQAQLRESEQRFRLAMANAPIGMALVGLDGRFIEVNDSLCAILGRARDELVALTFQDITHTEDLEADLANAGQLLAGEIHHYEMEKRYLHPSGPDVWALLSGSLVRDDEGEPLYFIAQIVDISARRRALLDLEHANQELERSNAELHRFAAVAAHDLRSPLATVHGFLDLLGDRYAAFLDQQGQQILQVARRVTAQMAESVEGLLTLAAVAVDRLDLEPVDLQLVLDEVAEAIAPALGAADAELQVGPLPEVSGDRTQLRLLFQNLLINAIKFRDPARALVVAVEAKLGSPFHRFAVQDNGRGFAAADRETIFEPFARTHEGYNIGATGIGLATCQRIVERHGGHIEAHPSEPGARFEFTLPDASPL